MSDAQKDKMLALLWNFLKDDPQHLDRKRTGYGTKTRDGLIACIDRIIQEE